MKTVSVALLSTLWIAVSLASDKDPKEHDKKLHAALSAAAAPSASDGVQLELTSIDDVPKFCIAMVQTLEEQERDVSAAGSVQKLRVSSGVYGRYGLRYIIRDINTLANKGLLPKQQRYIGYGWHFIELQIARSSKPLAHEDLQKRYAEVLSQCTAGTWTKADPEEFPPSEPTKTWSVFDKQPAELDRVNINLLTTLANQILGPKHIKVRTFRKIEQAPYLQAGAPYLWINHSSVDLVREKLKLKLVDKVYTPAEALLQA